jgi:hypothetical protein
MSSKLLASLFGFTLTALVLPAAAQVTAIHANQNLQPYTAEFKTTTVLTLANGTTVTRRSTQVEARDSGGRSMTSVTQETPGLNGRQWTHGSANDPVASTNTTWESNSKKATITRLPAKEEQKGCWANDAGTFRTSYGGESVAQSRSVHLAEARAQVPPATENLGTTTIQGVEATGRRVTTTIPTGQAGNDQPIVITHENWTSNGLGFVLALRTITDDPRSGVTTREVTNLTQGEPDAALFQPPDGYEVKTDELHPVACAQ